MTITFLTEIGLEQTLEQTFILLITFHSAPAIKRVYNYSQQLFFFRNTTTVL